MKTPVESEMPTHDSLPMPLPPASALAWVAEIEPGMHDELFEILRGPDPTLEERR